jgi:hypothetical protein
MVTEQDAIARVEAWLRGSANGDRTTGRDTLRVRPDRVTRGTGGWNVPFNAARYLDGTDVGTEIYPEPVVFTPDDGGEIRYATELMAASRPDPELEVPTDWDEIVDPEFDREMFPHLEVPERAILGWREVTLWEEPTGRRRNNPKHGVPPEWQGFPRARTAAKQLLNYAGVNWIDRETLLRELMDCEVLVPLNEMGEPVMYGAHTFQVYSSSDAVRPGFVRWRRMVLRDMFPPGLEMRFEVDPQRPLPHTFTQFEVPRALNSPRRGDVREPVDEVSPEVSPEVTAVVAGMTEEFGLDSPQVLTRVLRSAASTSRRNGYELTAEECLRFARGYAWKFRNLRGMRTGRPQQWPNDLAANGLVAHCGTDGEPRPEPWSFGKFLLDHRPQGRFEWHRVVGAFVGFALGDAIGSLVDERGSWEPSALRFGGLTRQLLFHTEAVIRGLPQVNEDAVVPAQLPKSGRPGGWLYAATADATPAVPEFSTLLATALAAVVTAGVEVEGIDENYATAIAHELVGAAAGPEVTDGVNALVRIFWQSFKTDHAPEYVLPPHIELPDLVGSLPEQSPVKALITTVLELRDERFADDAAQIETIGDGRAPLSVLGRALFAAAKRHYDPERAILTAVTHSGRSSVTGALAGALVGARGGIPALPAAWVAALPKLGLVQNVATDAFLHFHRFGVIREPSSLPAWEERYPSG